MVIHSNTTGRTLSGNNLRQVVHTRLPMQVTVVWWWRTRLVKHLTAVREVPGSSLTAGCALIMKAIVIRSLEHGLHPSCRA